MLGIWMRMGLLGQRDAYHGRMGSGAHYVRLSIWNLVPLLWPMRVPSVRACAVRGWHDVASAPGTASSHGDAVRGRSRAGLDEQGMRCTPLA